APNVCFPCTEVAGNFLACSAPLRPFGIIASRQEPSSGSYESGCLGLQLLALRLTLLLPNAVCQRLDLLRGDFFHLAYVGHGATSRHARLANRPTGRRSELTVTACKKWP